ncbi:MULTISPECIES: S8 family peptidase [Peribacillus]|uniref:S8 family peptidase n=1 Tax=Peribacillus TaxID=2675229 RepID=UPI000BA7A972|nr:MULTISPECIES: S8 family peptidase [Peribacillus]MBD8591431.1 S8 family peptidase [Peribacillus simplex]MCM3169633.1 S8 family peptidase [Peribacillus frigoritolerans]MEE3955773.1 S8 family peptidase [Peribacillus frigoritolerans]PAL04623.1 peptidase S8 [Peribacillus simplex]
MKQVIFPKLTKKTSVKFNYGISLVNAESFWKAGYKGQGVNVAVIDSGCSFHDELYPNIIDSFNLTTDDDGTINIANDYLGHGTHVSGIIAATNKNHMIGIAPQAKLLNIKVINKYGNSNFTQLIQGLKLALNWEGTHGETIDIINLSLGGTIDNSELRSLIDEALSKNITIVAAAGNEGDGVDTTDELSYPGYYKEVLQIGSINEKCVPTTYTNSNINIDYVSAGDNIFSTFLENDFATLSGTSMATPQVTGSIALLLSYFKTNDIHYNQATIGNYLTENTILLTGISHKLQGKGMIRLQGVVQNGPKS